MINVNLTHSRHWPHTCAVNAKSLARFDSLFHKRMYAAMRHFLCPKIKDALMFLGRKCGKPSGLPELVTGLLTRIVRPPMSRMGGG